MFHTPAGLDDNVQQFLRLEEAEKILTDLNNILRSTAFNPPTFYNPWFLLAVLASYGILSWHHYLSKLAELMLNQTHIVQGDEEEVEDEWGGVEEEEERSNTPLWILPYICFIIIVLVAKLCRKMQLTKYVAELNR